MRATAAVLRDDQGSRAIEAVELNAPGPGELLVRVVSSGVCHADMLLRQFPNEMPPFIGGHEGAGVVGEVDPGVTGVGVRDHVLLRFDSCPFRRPAD
ncbi:MAG: alcohol dehydrogenase catalytic domain-containing protein [Acidimicrobiia bacterium]